MFSLFLQDAWKVLLYSLLLGAGLPVVYALGVRASALGAAGADGADGADATAVRRRHALGRTLAGLCFLIVLAGVGVGLAYDRRRRPRRAAELRSHLPDLRPEELSLT